MMTSDLALNNLSPPALTSSTGFHPLSSSPANNALFQTGMTIPLTDDVTTIFVVGFPDDMTEREFQNMFMFCPGFAAASLKWHCKDQEDDNSIGSNTGKKQMIGFARFHTRLEAMEAVDILGGKKVDLDKGTVLKAEMAKKNLHVKRGSIAPTTNPLLPVTSTTLLQQQQQSRQSNLSLAVSMVSGEISSSSTTTTSTAYTTETTTITDPMVETSVITAAVDPTSTLTPSTPNSSTPTSSLGGRNSMVDEGTMSLLSKKLCKYPTSSATSSANGSYDAFSPLPSDLLSPADYKTDPFLNDPFTTCATTPSTPAFSDALFRNIRSNSFDERPASTEINLMSPPRHHHHHFGGASSGSTMLFKQGGQGSGFMMGPSPLAKSTSNNTGHPLHHHHHHHQQQSHHPLQQLHHPYQTTSSTFHPVDDDSYDYLSKSTPISNDRLFGTSPLFDDLMIANRMGSLTMQTSNAAAAPTLTDSRSPSVPAIHQHRTSINPADQNPPCNTLYVGNLPHNTNEDELRQLFSPCRGYKRMCFRNKPQGPMCFVEFDDVVLAKHALNEHQGAHLTNSVKGGIRLSYSKNPLFIKGGSSSPGSSSGGPPLPSFFNGKTMSMFD